MAWAAAVLVGAGLVVAGALWYVLAIYNGLVGVRHQVFQAWANIDVLLRQRHDELPQLIAVVRGAGAYERDLLERITALRTRIPAGPDAAFVAAEDDVTRGVAQLLATAEAYPALQADSAYRTLQRRISALEDQIAHRREFYNDAATINNARMEQFPDLLVARLAGLCRAPLFAATAAERASVQLGGRLAP